MSHGCDAPSRGYAAPKGFTHQPSARSRHIPCVLPALHRSPRPQIFVPSWPFSAPFPAVIGTSVSPTLTSSGCGDPWHSCAVSSPRCRSCPAPPARPRPAPGRHREAREPRLQVRGVHGRSPGGGDASGRALSACPQPGHPRVLSCPWQSISQRGRAERWRHRRAWSIHTSLSPWSRGGTLPRHPRPQLCPAAGKVAVTKARRGRGDPAIALGTFVPYSLSESVDFVPNLGVALGHVWRRWHGPKSPRDLAPDSR